MDLRDGVRFVVKGITASELRRFVRGIHPHGTHTDIRHHLGVLRERHFIFALQSQGEDVVRHVHLVFTLFGAENTGQRLFKVGIDPGVRKRTDEVEVAVGLRPIERKRISIRFIARLDD